MMVAKTTNSQLSTLHSPLSPVPAGYKRTEVGVIPEDWEVEEIQSLVEIRTGSRNTQDSTDNGLYPFYVRSHKVEKIDSYSFDGEAVLTAGDGVGTGKIFHYINGKFDVHQRVYQLTGFGPRLDGYFFFLIFSTRFYQRIMQMTAKSSVDSVRREMIAKMEIPIPPKAEQEAIAEALSDADAWIASLEQLIAKKRLIKPRKGPSATYITATFTLRRIAFSNRATRRCHTCLKPWPNRSIDSVTATSFSRTLQRILRVSENLSRSRGSQARKSSPAYTRLRPALTRRFLPTALKPTCNTSQPSPIS